MKKDGVSSGNDRERLASFISCHRVSWLERCLASVPWSKVYTTPWWSPPNVNGCVAVLILGVVSTPTGRLSELPSLKVPLRDVKRRVLSSRPVGGGEHLQGSSLVSRAAVLPGRLHPGRKGPEVLLSIQLTGEAGSSNPAGKYRGCHRSLLKRHRKLLPNSMLQ